MLKGNNFEKRVNCMTSSTIRVDDKTLKIIRRISKEAGISMQEILDKAVEDYRRKQVLMEANEAYKVLRENPGKWKEEIEERQEWDTTIADNLEEQK